MSFGPGTRLGVYEVTAQIGEGGMGQVYRATDISLGRQVAIKVLPDAFAQDAERLARFEREAKTLAALNHPNIAAIYGLERSSGTQALVMELVEGEDLSQRIVRGAIPLDEALPIARQIADALETAHEQGIIHRDLKPANIKVRPDGTVKVLDFGLAKAMEPSGLTTGAASASPTITTPAMTHAGTILGTAAYMSPEQARGRHVDKRADVWAFGAVLFEMLTAQRAFPGEDITDTIVSVVSKEPNWTALPAGTPAGLRRLLDRCLKKDARGRMRDIGEARLQLEELASGTAEELLPSPAAAAHRSLAARAMPWALVAALAAGVVAGWTRWRTEKALDLPLVRLDIDLGTEVLLPAPAIGGSSVAISPDGKRLAYASGTPAKLFTRRLDQATATELPGTAGAVSPFFSPDGEWIAFVARNKMNKISVDGGTVVALADVPNATFRGASWSEDGSILFCDYSGLLQIPAGGGRPVTVGGLGPEELLTGPQVLPGGKAIVFSAHSSPDVNKFTVEVLTRDDHRRKIVLRGGGSPRFVSTSISAGHLLYTNGSALFAIPFDLEKLETRGPAVPILDDVAYQAAFATGQFAVSRTGTLVYRRTGSGRTQMTTLQWVDSTGKREPLRAVPAVYNYLSLAPDGKRMALVASDGGSQDVWVYDPQRDAMTRLTFGDAVYLYPRWSPDGRYVVFSSQGMGIVQARADGSSQPHALTQGKTAQFPWSFTPDGKRLAYDDLGVSNWHIWTVPIEEQGGQLNAGTPEQIKSNFYDLNPAFSPDGRWLAYESNESGISEVYVRAFPLQKSGQSGKWQISNGGGAWPRWSGSGSEVVYRSGDDLMAASYTVRDGAFIAAKPRVWIARLGSIRWDLAPDGKRVAVITPVESAATSTQDHEVVFLQNFFDELRRRAPLEK